MSVVWAVSHGDYSDYSVQAIFATKEVAEEYVARLNALEKSYVSDDDYRIEEFPFYAQMPRVITIWHVSQQVFHNPSSFRNPNDDSPPDMRIWASAHIGDDEAPPFWVHTYPRSGVYSPSVEARGVDKERCIKSVADRIARLRAEREGIA